MKKVIFVKVDKGVKTPESKAEALRKFGHLVAINQDPISGHTIKHYYLGALHDMGMCAEVVIAGGRVVSVRNVPETVLRQLVRDDVPKFGGF